MTGKHVADQLKTLDPKLAIIFATGYMRNASCTKDGWTPET